METKPTAFHSLDEWVSESQISAAATIYNPTAADKKAPAAEPEGEDVDMEVSPEIKKPGMSETKAVRSQCAHMEAESMGELQSTETHQTLCENEFPPPPPDFSDLPIEEACDKDFSIAVIAAEWMDSEMSNQVHDLHCCQKRCADVFNVNDTTDSTNLTVRECTDKNSECIVPCLPFADEGGEASEVDMKSLSLDKCDVSESGVSAPAVDDLEQFPHCELSTGRDIQALTVSPSFDYHKSTFANGSKKDVGAYEGAMDFQCDVLEFTASTLQRELSLQYQGPLMSGIQSGQEYSGDAGEREDTIDLIAFPDELTEENSTAFSPLLANNKDNEKASVDIFRTYDYESNESEYIVPTSLARDASQQQGKLFPLHHTEYSGYLSSVEVGEGEDMTGSKALSDIIEPNAFPDVLSEAALSVQSPLFTYENEDEEAYNNTLHNLDCKSNVSEFTILTSPVEAVSEQQGELSLQSEVPLVSDIQACQEYCGDDIVQSVDTIEPIALPDELTNVTVSKAPSNYGEDIVQSLFSANKSNENKEAYNDTLHDYGCTVSGSTATTSHVVVVSEQQGEPYQQYELASVGVNHQEATQQVLNQASSPLSSVSMEPANHAALREGSGGVIGESRVGHGTLEGESRPISAYERLFKEIETVGPLKEVLKSVQEQKSEKSRHVSFQHRTMESDSCDESDSGVSADYSPGSTLESAGSSGNVHKETPIEREIRRAIEREHSLRRSRGLPNPPTSVEYVEIPLKTAVLYQPLPPTKSEKCQGKDRQFAGKKMQQDIHEEAQREQDLVKLGKIPGFYDKGTVRQLKEKKQLFEAFQKPSDSCSVKTNAVSSLNNIYFSENDSLCHKGKGTGSDTRNELTIASPTVFPEAKSCQVIIIENNFDLPTVRPNTNIGAITTVDSSADKKTRKAQDENGLDLKAPKENPFFKLRSSTSVVKVEQDIREAQERERELHKQRINLYGTRVEKGGGRAAKTEENSGTLSSLKALPVQDLPDSSQTGVTTTTATTTARHSTGKLGVWPPAPADHQTEVHLCPRTPRQKNLLVQRWESGLINAQED